MSSGASSKPPSKTLTVALLVPSSFILSGPVSPSHVTSTVDLNRVYSFSNRVWTSSSVSEPCKVDDLGSVVRKGKMSFGGREKSALSIAWGVS